MISDAARHSDGVLAILFDIDGTLITAGGASAVAWCRAFADLYEVPVNVACTAPTRSAMPARITSCPRSPTGSRCSAHGCGRAAQRSTRCGWRALAEPPAP